MRLYGFASLCLAAVMMLTATAAGQATQPADQPRTDAAAKPMEDVTSSMDVDRQIEALRRELDALLTPAGLPAEDDADTREQLEAIASRSGDVQRQAVPGESQTQAANVQLRAYNALAQEAQVEKRSVDAGFRVQQLRHAAKQANEAAREGGREGGGKTQGRLVGDFWLLLADLIEINAGGGDLRWEEQRQAAAIEKLNAFVTGHAEAEGGEKGEGGAGADGHAMLIQTRVALAELLARAGRNEAACDQIEALGKALEDLPRETRQRLEPAAAACAVIGRVAKLDGLQRNPANDLVQNAEDAEGKGGESRGEPWSLASLRGKVVVLSMFDASTEDAVPWREAPDRTPALAWVFVAVGGGDVSASGVGPAVRVSREAAERLGVRSLPAYVVIDREGHIVAVGGTRAVVAGRPELWDDEAAAGEDGAE